MDIVVWLRSLGLGKYEAAFRENEIDETGADMAAETRLADLESTLALVKFDHPLENAALLAPLLDIPLPADRALPLPPEELRRRQLAALTNWWITGARAQPAVAVVEDLHWADPTTTLDLLRGLAERGARAV